MLSFFISIFSKSRNKIGDSRQNVMFEAYPGVSWRIQFEAYPDVKMGHSGPFCTLSVKFLQLGYGGGGFY